MFFVNCSHVIYEKVNVKVPCKRNTNKWSFNVTEHLLPFKIVFHFVFPFFFHTLVVCSFAILNANMHNVLEWNSFFFCAALIILSNCSFCIFSESLDLQICLLLFWQPILMETSFWKSKCFTARLRFFTKTFINSKFIWNLGVICTLAL